MKSLHKSSMYIRKKPAEVVIFRAQGKKRKTDNDTPNSPDYKENQSADKNKIFNNIHQKKYHHIWDLLPKPLQNALSYQPFLIIDGGLGSLLVTKGLLPESCPLWSSQLLQTDETAVPISNIHNEYLIHGADIIITSTYQASISYFQKYFNCNEETAIDKMNRSILIAEKAIEKYKNDKKPFNQNYSPLIIGSIGPMSAFISSEYNPDYSNVTNEQIRDFHYHRMEILSKHPSITLLCFETQSNLDEISVLIEILQTLYQQYHKPAMLSLACRNQYELNDGSSVFSALQLITNCPHIIAAGFNCTAPEYIPSLLKQARSVFGNDKIIFCYPNNGSQYNPIEKTWSPVPTIDWDTYSSQFYNEGALMIGGCCMTTPENIQTIYNYREKIRNTMIK